MKTYEYYYNLFLEYLKSIDFKEYTRQSYIYSLKVFACFLKVKGINDFKEVNTNTIYDLIKYLKNKKTALKKEYSYTTVSHIVSQVKQFYRFLYRNDAVIVNPFNNVSFDITGISKKREIFSVDEINIFLDSIAVNDGTGLRDRSIFELMYSSGLRKGETVKLLLNDVDLKERVLLIRNAKGDKDRVVPFSEIAGLFLKKYIATARKAVLKRINKDVKYLFLSKDGDCLSKEMLYCTFKKYLKAVKMDNKGLCLHSIRHTTATHLLESGAGVRYVQELLGHSDIETTVKYTHLMIESLKRVYKMHHPKENKYYCEIDDEYLNELEILEKECLKREKRKHLT